MQVGDWARHPNGWIGKVAIKDGAFSWCEGFGWQWTGKLRKASWSEVADYLLLRRDAFHAWEK